MPTFQKIFFFVGMLFANTHLLAQVNNVDNLGFEKGTFEGWQLSYGDVKLVGNSTTYSNEKTGTISNRHQIVTVTDGNDPKITQETMPMVSKGGNYSMRIGKTVDGSTFERATTSFAVTSQHSLFQYHFAVLLQEDANNRHSKPQKPGFALKITDVAGTPIVCGDFDVQLEGNPLAGFKTQGDIEYKNWTTGSIDLRNHIGKTLKVEITVHGCTGQKHFGYAYFDAELIKSELFIPSSCPDENGLISINAPEGFDGYTWSNGMVGQKIKTIATVGQIFSVAITPYSTLNATCNFTLEAKVPFVKAESNISKSICEGEMYRLIDAEYGVTGKYTKIISRYGLCDSTINLNLFVGDMPKINININKCVGETIKIGSQNIIKEGYYVVNIPRIGKCDSIVQAKVQFEDLKISVSENQKITAGDSLILNSQILTGNGGSSLWQSNSGIICSNCINPIVKPTKDEVYNFKVKSSSGICSRTGSVNVNVVPCDIYFPSAFTPDNDPQNPVFYGLGGSCISKIQSFEIYNRWGELVFRNNDFINSDNRYGWNGKVKNIDAAAGIYTYEVKALLKNGDARSFGGKVTLLR